MKVRYGLISIIPTYFSVCFLTESFFYMTILVINCCVTNKPQLNGIKQQLFCSVGQKLGMRTVEMACLFTVLYCLEPQVGSILTPLESRNTWRLLHSHVWGLDWDTLKPRLSCDCRPEPLHVPLYVFWASSQYGGLSVAGLLLWQVRALRASVEK